MTSNALFQSCNLCKHMHTKIITDVGTLVSSEPNEANISETLLLKSFRHCDLFVSFEGAHTAKEVYKPSVLLQK